MATPTSKTRVSPASLLKKSKNISDIRADLNDLISCISTSSDLDVERAKAKLMQKVSGTEKTSAKAVNSRGKSRHGIMRSVEFFRENPLVLAGVTGILFAAHILAQNEECNACETPDSC
ncbi:MAG: hypothetical protein ABI865_14880, partial [Nitrosospira sp.]